MKNISLRTKTIIAATLLVFLILALLFIGNISLSKKQIRERFNAEIEQFKLTAAGCLYLPIKEKQTQTVSEILSGLLQKKDVLCIEIYLANSPKEIFFAKQKTDGNIKETTLPLTETSKYIVTQMTLRPIDNTGVNAGYIKFFFDTASMQSDYNAARRNSWILFICGWLLLSAFIYLFVKKNYLSPLKKLTLNIENLSVTSFDNPIYMKTFQNSQREFAIIENSLNQYIRKTANIIERLQNFFRQLKDISKENLKLSLDFENSVNAEASAIEEISATLVESSASILNISNSTHSSAERLSTSAEKAKASFNLIDQITSSITDISEQSKKIQNALSLIYDVTNETEMLAMNASIEAAKAGEFGKGFSVVANEIRELAEKSQESVSEIDEKIRQNNEIVENTQDVITDSQKTLKEILEMTVVSDQFLSQISVAINETSTGQDELLKAVDNINAVMTKIVSLVSEMKTRAEKIDEISSIMEDVLKQ